ncbi:MAG TPA: hypothetical protein VG055_15405, partial [Planctomycetaceae bacterium]|nr:hypothetical protein [Planctomycetaceae bacterium]
MFKVSPGRVLAPIKLNRRSVNRWLPLVVAIASFASGMSQPARAGDRRLPASEFKDGPRVHEAFREVVSRVNASTVAVLVDGRQIALGVIVSPDGYILTKASDLSDDLQCRIRGGGIVGAKIVGIHSRYDVA